MKHGTIQAIAPLQARSRESLAKMLDAAERILERKEFDEMSIADIAAEAGLSVGAFYTRFRSKEALLAVLHERYEHERLEFLTNAFAAADRPGAGLAERARAFTGAIIALFRSRRGVLRSLVLKNWRQGTETTGRTRQRVDAIVEAARKLLLAARSEIKHPDADMAVRTGIASVLAAARESIVLRPAGLPGAPKLSDDALARELAIMLHAYLTSPKRGGARL